MPYDDDNSDFEWVPPTPAEMKIIEAKRERNNQISRLMGEYMLKGYRMLDKLCDECGTILLMDRNEELYCVACAELSSETSKDDPVLSEKAALATVMEHQQKNKSSTSKPAFENSNAQGTTGTSVTNNNAYEPSNDNHNNMTCDNQVESVSSSSVFHETSERSERNFSDQLEMQQQRVVTIPGASTNQQNGNVSSTKNSLDFTSQCVSQSFKKELPNLTSSIGILDISNSVMVLNEKIKFFTEKLSVANSVHDTVEICNAIKACCETLHSLKRLL